MGWFKRLFLCDHKWEILAMTSGTIRVYPGEMLHHWYTQEVTKVLIACPKCGAERVLHLKGRPVDLHQGKVHE